MKLFFSIAFFSFTISISAQKESCFDFVYPLTFELSNGSTIEVDSHRALMKFKSSWKQNEELPNLKFPIEVKWPGKDPMVVENEEMFDRHMNRCKKHQATMKE